MKHTRAAVLVAGCLASATALACIVVPPPPPPPHPKPAFLEVRQQHIKLSFEHPVVRTVVETTLYNPHSRPIEGTFIFPLPPDASVTKFVFFMDGKPVKGEILPADKARQVYLDIVRRLRDPALLEYSQAGLFTARLFPVPARKTSKIRLECLQTLKVDNNLVRYFHNIRLGRSQTPSKGRLVIEGRIHSKVPLKAIFSPTHEIDISRVDDHTARFSYETSQRPYERDFVLCYGVAQAEMGMHLLTHRDPPDDGYFLLLLSPPAPSAKKAPPKDIVFVLDTSGSMRGEKIRQAKEGLRYALDALSPDDRFAFISFATMPRLHSPLAPATKANIARAKRFVDDLEAAGGTALNDALVEACQTAQRSRRDRPSYILLFTDGRPTVGERDEGKIVKNVVAANKADGSPKSRLFLLGVGYDVNARLLDLLAERNGGATQYVGPEEDLELAICSLVDKIGHPALTDLSIDFSGDAVRDVQPARLRDLFRGEQLLLVARYVRPAKVRVTLTGRLEGQRKRKWRWDLALPKRERQARWLPRLWATRQVGYLLDQVRLHGESKELKEEIIRLALKFGIVTPYTSYLVAEEGEEIAARRPAWRAARLRGGPAGPTGAPGMGAFGEGSQTQVRRQWQAGMAPAARGYGADAVKAAQSTAAMQQAVAVPAVVSAQAQTVRHIAGKTFYLDPTSGYWVDSEYLDTLRQVKVRYLSDRYLALCAQRPDIAQWLAIGSKVKLRIDDVALVVAEDIEENLRDEDIKSLGR